MTRVDDSQLLDCVSSICTPANIPEFHECPLCGRVASVKYSEHKEVVSESEDIVVHGKIGCKLCSLYIEDKTAPNPHTYDLNFLRTQLVQDWNRLTYHPKRSKNNAFTSILDFLTPPY